jgi:hypothetical protein
LKPGRRLLLIGGIALTFTGLVGAICYRSLFPPPKRYASDVEQFKYGSIGVEAASGMPYEIWRALPALCMPPADRARGFARFGFQWEPGHVTPIGMPVEKALVTRIGVNCAMCHVGRATTPDGRTMLLPGAPNTQLDVQSYLRFLFACADSPRFTADAILGEMRKHRKIGLTSELLYRWLIIPQTRKALLKQARQMEFMNEIPPWGPGRAAGFNPAKIKVLGRAYDHTIDTVDFPALWAMARRQPGGLHWDGLNTSLHEVFLNSGIGNGASVRSLNRAALDRDEAWARRTHPLPYPMAIDPARARDGRLVFDRECASCHSPSGSKVNQVIPISWVQTDRNRLDSISDDVLRDFRVQFEHSLHYQHFRKTDGYVAAPLDGIWARSPYLHNGAVPTLRDLLERAVDRPSSFVRGEVVLDPVRGGFAARPCHPPTREGRFCFDTNLPGNGNGGHDYGTTLPSAQKDALVAYLLTL